jgi:hypothetical protein
MQIILDGQVVLILMETPSMKKLKRLVLYGLTFITMTVYGQMIPDLTKILKNLIKKKSRL